MLYSHSVRIIRCLGLHLCARTKKNRFCHFCGFLVRRFCRFTVQAAPHVSSLDTTRWQHWLELDWSRWGQVGITMAYHRANAAWVSAFSYLTVIVATFYGFVLFDEALSIADWAGGVLIVGSGIALVFLAPPAQPLDKAS